MRDSIPEEMYFVSFGLSRDGHGGVYFRRDRIPEEMYFVSKLQGLR